MKKIILASLVLSTTAFANYNPMPTGTDISFSLSVGKFVKGEVVEARTTSPLPYAISFEERQERAMEAVAVLQEKAADKNMGIIAYKVKCDAVGAMYGGFYECRAAAVVR